MLWEELTAPQFEEAAKNSGVCILPIGVIEKHGNHLPLGTDMISVTAVCKTAAEREPSVVFPYYFLGQIAEARHYPGTLSASHRLLMENLLEMCDEIGRNGIKKILIMSGHGGNNHFLPFFAQEMPRLNRDYLVYTGFIGNMTKEQEKQIAEAAGTDDLGNHAGLAETAMIMYLRPDLVYMKEQDPSEAKGLDRLSKTRQANLFSGFDWYGFAPYHFSGDPTKATPQVGKLIFDAAVDNTVKAVKAVKEDNLSAKLAAEFAEYARKPSSKIKH